MDAKKILIVDDEVGVRESFGLIFESKGFVIEEAGNGKEGFEKAVSFKPDVIILDVVMPVMTGLEAAHLMRKDERTKDIPIIFCTGSHEDEVKQAGIAKVSFLGKPFTVEDVRAKVDEVL